MTLIRVREERAVARVWALLGLHAADGEDQVIGLAREEVSAARAAVPEQAVAGEAALDLGAVGRRRARHDAAALLLDPAKGRDVVVRAQQDPCLAGAGLRGEVGLPFDEAVRPVRDPARHRRRVAVPHRPLDHGLERARRSRGSDPGTSVSMRSPDRPGDPLDDPNHVRVVVVRPGHDFEHGGDRRDDERSDDPRPNPPTSTAPSVSASTTRRTTALRTRSRRNDVATVYGSRTAATMVRESR